LFRSIQVKLVFVYLLMILVAMELGGFYLLQSLEASYLKDFRYQLSTHGELLVGLLQRDLAEPFTSDHPVRENIERAVRGYTNPGVRVWVLDRNGVVLAATSGHEQLIGKRVENEDIAYALAGTPRDSLWKDPDTAQPFAVSALPVRSPEGDRVVGVIYLRESLENMYANLGRIRRTLLYATGLALGATVILGFALARTITGPIREVTRRAQEMAAGNFDQTITVRSQDEVGQLGRAFNLMTAQLKQTLADIRQEQSRLEAILANMADGLLALDAGGRIIKANPAAQRLLGQPEEALLGRTVGEVWPDLGLEEDVREAAERSSTVSRMLLLDANGGATAIQSYVTALQPDPGRPGGAVIVLHDVTELQRLENMRREFVANVSHELKTPLTTVKSYVETLLDGAVEDPALGTRFLRVVESETDRMVRLVRDLLSLSQMDQGMQGWDIGPVDLPTLVDEAVARLAVPAERKRLQVSRHYQPGLEMANADRDKLMQVLLNVLANAIEFTPEQGRVYVEVLKRGTMAEVVVRDTGIGIPKEDLPRIFERFYRVDKARSRMLGGTGLGLAIARQIVEMHGGQIGITSDLGKGTEVRFTVPCVSHAQVAAV
jgi:two-component system sensor histidine kinase VicK